MSDVTWTHFSVENRDHRRLYRLMCSKRGVKNVDFTFYPPTGFIVFHLKRPVCVGFLVKCDNKTVISEGLVSDPEVSKWVRRESVAYYRKLVLNFAKKFGARVILCDTDVPKLAERLLEQGYTEVKYNSRFFGRVLTWP